MEWSDIHAKYDELEVDVLELELRIIQLNSMMTECERMVRELG